MTLGSILRLSGGFVGALVLLAACSGSSDAPAVTGEWQLLRVDPQPAGFGATSQHTLCLDHRRPTGARPLRRPWPFA